MGSCVNTIAVRTDSCELSDKDRETHAAPTSVVLELEPDLRMRDSRRTHPLRNNIRQIRKYMDHEDRILPVGENFVSVDRPNVRYGDSQERKKCALPSWKAITVIINQDHGLDECA